jgi:hypothetical protein
MFVTPAHTNGEKAVRDSKKKKIGKASKICQQSTTKKLKVIR